MKKKGDGDLTPSRMSFGRRTGRSMTMIMSKSEFSKKMKDQEEKQQSIAEVVSVKLDNSEEFV